MPPAELKRRLGEALDRVHMAGLADHYPHEISGGQKQRVALALSHRIAVMRDGRIEQLDEPSRIYGFQVNRFVADFIGNCNLLKASV